MSFINHVFFVLFYFIVFNFEYQSANRVPFCPYRMKIHTLTYPHTADIYTPPYTAITMSKLFPKWTIYTHPLSGAGLKKEREKQNDELINHARAFAKRETHTYIYTRTYKRKSQYKQKIGPRVIDVTLFVHVFQISFVQELCFQQFHIWQLLYVSWQARQIVNNKQIGHLRSAGFAIDNIIQIVCI